MVGYFSADIICSVKRKGFPRAFSTKNCELRETDNVQTEISEHIFAPNDGSCVYYPSNLFCNALSSENWGMFADIPQFQLEMFDHVTCLDQSRASENIWWIIRADISAQSNPWPLMQAAVSSKTLVKIIAELRRLQGLPSGAPYPYRKQKETHELTTGIG